MKPSYPLRRWLTWQIWGRELPRHRILAPGLQRLRPDLATTLLGEHCKALGNLRRATLATD
jgi:hypothetical protein